MNAVVESREIVLSEPSGLYFVGPDAPDPWLDDPRQALRFSSASQAWRYAEDLVQTQGDLLEGHPVALETYDPVTHETSRVVTTDDVYATMRSRWHRGFGEPLPLDIPNAPEYPEVARERVREYLSRTDWTAVRARGGDSFGFDPSFWIEADKLFQSDQAGFRSLWSSVVPPDIDCPDLSSPRWQSALAAAGSPEESNEVIQELPALSVAPNDSADSAPSSDPPAFVARHFVESRGGFYYKQRPDVLAFSRRGQSFRARDDSVVTATAIVELAQQRGWSSVRVSGSKAFRRAVWTAASERGIGVCGYSPTPGEMAVLAQSSSPDGHPARSDGSTKTVSARSTDASLRGLVVDTGAAPYRHDRSNSDSFYVTLRSSDGQEHTHWGVGLQKAIEQASVARGDLIALERLGKESVEVDRPVLDAMGDVSFSKHEVVERRKWGVRVLDQTREASPGAVDTPIPPRASADPEMAKALALIEKRMPQMSEAQRQELRRHFDTAYARLSKSPPADGPTRGRSPKSVSRSGRGR